MRLSPEVQQRSSPRTFVILPVSIKLSQQDSRPHAGIVRDVSREGIFFYSDFTPKLRSSVHFEVRIGERAFNCAGVVVRVQETMQGAAVGIALKFKRCSAITAVLAEAAKPKTPFYGTQATGVSVDW